MQEQVSLTNGRTKTRKVMIRLRTLLIPAVLAWAGLSMMTAQAQLQDPQTVQLRAALQGVVTEAGVQCPKMKAAPEAEKTKQTAAPRQPYRRRQLPS
jgi:hypothetical protein